MKTEQYTEKAMLDQALAAFGRETGLHATVQIGHVRDGQQVIDAIIALGPDNKPMFVEVKKWTTQQNVGALIQRMRQMPQPALLIANYVNPQLAEKLRTAGVQFIDCAGNAYINQPPLYIQVVGKKRPTDWLDGDTGHVQNKAFDKTGLKVVYDFLCHPVHVDWPYRKIAEHTGVAQGTVGWVMKGLKGARFIHTDAEGKRTLVNQQDMLNRWVDMWPIRLKPRLFEGEFTIDQLDWWRGLDITQFKAQWGGETAAAIMTDHLQPEVVTVYVENQHKANLIKAGRLRKAHELDTGMRVRLYRPFWAQPRNNFFDECVHPVLVYADLIATADPRNLEVAEIIHDKYIKPLLD